MRATSTFFAALDDLVAAGADLPCWDRTHGNPWLSEDHEAREYAAHRCGSCPLRTECVDMATDLDCRFGVYGGLDFAQRPGRRRRAPKGLAA